MQILQGYRTYTSIILMIIGWFGLFERLGVTREEVSKLIDDIMVVVFGVTAIYYNWKNHQKMVQ